MSDSKKTLIEEGTELKGTVNSSCPIVVMGRVEGELTGPSVEVTESGVVSGKAKVTELRSRGELAGEFDADIVELSGKVRDKTSIKARMLEVNLHRSEGRVEMVFGECELNIGDAPDKAKAVRDATAGGHARPVAASATTPTSAPDMIQAAAPTEEADSAVSGKNGRRPKKAADEHAEGA